MDNAAEIQLWALIERLKEDGYSSVTDADREKYHKLLAQCQKYDGFLERLAVHLTEITLEQKKENERINAQIRQKNTEIARNFNIAEHYQALSRAFSSLKDDNIKHYFPSVENLKIEDIRVTPDCRRLTAPVEMRDGDEKTSYIHQVREVLLQITTAQGQPNQNLAMINKEHPINFKIMDSKDCDGHFNKEEFDKNGNVIIEINSGCFTRENIDKLPMLMSHECGHLLDIYQRYKYNPATKDYKVSVKAQEEYMADILGVSMCANAGYHKSINKFKNYIKQHGNPLQRADIIEKNQIGYQKKLLSLSGRTTPETTRGVTPTVLPHYSITKSSGVFR